MTVWSVGRDIIFINWVVLNYFHVYSFAGFSSVIFMMNLFISYLVQIVRCSVFICTVTLLFYVHCEHLLLIFHLSWWRLCTESTSKCFLTLIIQEF